MEIVIPPRNGGPSTYKYAWDENGEVISTQRVGEATNDHGRRGRGRQTVQWPFQSIITETTIPTPALAQFHFRRATWQPRGLLRDDDSVTSPVDIPDYVINYIRGETPETVARRMKNGGKVAERDVNVERNPNPNHQHQRSRAADFDGFYDENSSRSRTMTSHCATDQHILPGNEKPNRGIRRLTHGWRGGVAVNALLAFLMLVAGFVCLILAVSKSQTLAGETVIYSGSCSTALNINWGLHALISVMVVILIAGANYVFQVLSSPTRPELAAAHDKRKWMDIGIPSIRNFAHISNGRVFLSLTILIAAVITQVIYNSIIFTSQVGVNYSLLFVTQSFLTGAPFSNATSNNSGGLSRIDILALQDLAGRNQLVNLTTAECMSEFGGAFDTNFRAVLVVTDIDSANSSLIQTGTPGNPLSQYSIATTSRPSLLAGNSAVEFCLAQPNDGAGTCNVSLNASLLGIVALLNLLTIICTAGVLFKTTFEPLVTLGDAIVSFLKDPDPTTRGSCLMTKADVHQQRWGLHESKYYKPRSLPWLHSASLGRWMSISFIWLSLVGLAAAALGVTTHSNPTRVLSAFGTASPHGVYLLPSSAPASAAALVASLPQILLAVLYFATNSLMSSYFLSHESSLHAVGGGHGTPLRVSTEPEGRQTTSLYLTLPRPWSWALLTLFAGMGFVLSQAVVPVTIHFADASASSSSTTTGPSSSGPALIALGFSGVALLSLLALLVVLAAVILGLGLRRSPPCVTINGEAMGNPLVLSGGSCSAVISARCHRHPRESDVWLHPVSFGVVHYNPEMNVSHATYSARRVGQLDLSRSYA